ncbi:MAG: hypothetical protein J6Y02_11895 [Pseudobutyrivibrio sp.]|nr:hypothetical protein [Pseudobutyrivibrio sp.]
MKTMFYIMKVTRKYCKKWNRHDYLNVYRILKGMFETMVNKNQLDRDELMLFIQYDPSLLIWRYSRREKGLAA